MANVESKKHNTRILDSRWDMCEHLEVGDTAKLVLCEDDSFGPVARMAFCDECSVKANEDEQAIEEECVDCGNEFPRSEVSFYKWYGFHAPSGEEPLIICNGCHGKPKHQKRIASDRSEYEADFPMEDDHEEY